MANKKKWAARSGQAANQAVGLFNPMRFLHSMDTWKKAETEVQPPAHTASRQKSQEKILNFNDSQTIFQLHFLRGHLINNFIFYRFFIDFLYLFFPPTVQNSDRVLDGTAGVCKGDLTVHAKSYCHVFCIPSPLANNVHKKFAGRDVSRREALNLGVQFCSSLTPKKDLVLIIH